MTDNDKLTDFELKILREVDGREPASPWGAAVGHALSVLAGGGYITRKFGGKLTDKGRKALE